MGTPLQPQFLADIVELIFLLIFYHLAVNYTSGSHPIFPTCTVAAVFEREFPYFQMLYEFPDGSKNNVMVDIANVQNTLLV